tara:strand:- start:420 stop:653 length:234 start_codon:yes stop_codon:yes gene_type:complete
MSSEPDTPIVLGVFAVSDPDIENNVAVPISGIFRSRFAAFLTYNYQPTNNQKNLDNFFLVTKTTYVESFSKLDVWLK